MLKIKVPSKEETINYIKNNHEFLNDFTKKDLEYRLQHKNASKEEYLDFYYNQIIETSEKEKKAISDLSIEMNKVLETNNYNLPDIGEISIVKSTQKEECGSAAYTRGTSIFLCPVAFDILVSKDADNLDVVKTMIWHELFHCLSRNSFNFKKEMYKVIKFNVLDKDFIIPEELKNNMITNPDVVRHNAYGSLLIDDKYVDAYFILTSTKDFEKEGDIMFNSLKINVVSINDSKIYNYEDVKNMNELFGENTDYVIDPEECLADNFSFAITKGMNGDYKTPEIVEGIINNLKK